MLLSILANLVGLYSLVTLPVATNFTIDVSDFYNNGQIKLLESAYIKDAPYKINNNSMGMEVTASSAMIIDKKTGTVLWQKNPEQVRSLASLTKLMSALVFLDHKPLWDTEVTIQRSDYREGGRIRVYAGEKIKVSDLFNASLVASSNNATMALIRSTGLTEEEFVAEMNAKAKSLEMLKSHFVEPTGLDPENISTAQDVSRLIKAAFNQPAIISATNKEEFQFSVINAPRSYTLENTNKLLSSYLNIKAGKTGFLDEAGYCLASLIKGDAGEEIYLVVLGSESEPSRFQETKALAQWAFDNYVWN